MERFNLRDGVQPQTYGLGIKELWEIEPAQHSQGPGRSTPSAGRSTARTYGGSWLYMFGENLVSVGFVVGLDYANPYLSPFEEMQRFKTHPAIRPIFEGGRRIAYGARALNEGGFQSIPKLVFPGGALIGDTAGFLNVPKIKGTHTAMKSGMVAAEAAFDGARRAAPSAPELDAYPERLRRAGCGTSSTGCATSARPSIGACGRPWPTRRSTPTCCAARRPGRCAHQADHDDAEAGRPSAQPIELPAARRQAHLRPAVLGVPSNTNHEEDQPAHLRLKDPSVAERVNLAGLRRPGAALLPGRGLRVRAEADGGSQRLQINAQNCVHCKTCDIKDPTQNIDWVTPEGGGGPNYIGGM